MFMFEKRSRIGNIRLSTGKMKAHRTIYLTYKLHLDFGVDGMSVWGKICFPNCREHKRNNNFCLQFHGI